MYIIAVDDEKLALESIVSVIKEAVNECEVYGFMNPNDALNHISNNPCDIAFLDIKMRGITGLELAKKIKEIKPLVNIVFATGYSDYTIEAFSLAASDYLLKPIDVDQINRALSNLRNPVNRKASKKIRIQCFGNFEIFVDDKPLYFKRSKSKELIAYLVDRMGASCTMGELMAILWEDGIDDSSMRSNLRNIIADVKATFDSVGLKQLINKDRNVISLNVKEVECDYYDFLKHESYAVNKYRGEYMIQYSWAEMSLSRLNK